MYILSHTIKENKRCVYNSHHSIPRLKGTGTAEIGARSNLVSRAIHSPETRFRIPEQLSRNTVGLE